MDEAVTMKFSRFVFNVYLGLALLSALALTMGGCRSAERKKKLATTLRFHLEKNPDGTERTATATVGRAAPFQISVESDPFLTEVYIVKASLLDAVGGHQIFLTFDRQGTWLLEQYTTANKGRRIAIFSQFGDARWLAAPVITKQIADGMFTFAPDATREEAERIVAGLLEVAKEVRKEEKF